MVLAKQFRIKKKLDFERVFKNGKLIPLTFGWLRVIKNELNFSRFGIIVGAKVSKKAVVRNRLRRQISEIYRVELEKIPAGYDIVFIAKPAILKKQFQEMEKEILRGLNQSLIRE